MLPNCRLCGEERDEDALVDYRCPECHTDYGPFCESCAVKFAELHLMKCEAREVARRKLKSACEPRPQVAMEEVYSNDLLTRLMLSTGRLFMQRGPREGDWRC